MKLSNFKRTVLLLPALCMTVSLAACGTTTAPSSESAPAASASSSAAPAASSVASAQDNPDEQVTLRIMYAGPGTLADTQMVLDAFNEELKKSMPNTVADIEFVLSSNYEEKLRLVLSANEALDVANLTSGSGEARNNLVSESRKGAMTPLDDLLAAKPEFYDLIPGSLWDLCKAGGVTYMVPINKEITDRYVGVNMQADLADQYCDVPRLREILGADNGSLSQEAWDILTDYLVKLKAAGEIRHGASPATMRWLPERAFYSLYDKAFVVHKEDNTCCVVNYFETEDAKLMFKMFYQWWNEGLIDQNVLSADDKRQWERKEDGHTLWMAGHKFYDPTYTGPVKQWESEAENSENWQFQVRAIGWEKNIFITPVGNGLQGLFIPRTSKNPQRALEYIWQTNSNYDLLVLLAYGIEGVHYTRTEENNFNIDVLVKEADQAKYRGEMWNIGNTFLPDPYSTDGSGWIDYSREITMGKAVVTPLASYQIDIDPIKNELEQYTAVRNEYEWALDCGAVEDWESYYNDMITKMKAAGSDKIIEELQSQVDEFLANR